MKGFQESLLAADMGPPHHLLNLVRIVQGFFVRAGFLTCEMAQWEKAFAAKPGNRSLIPWTNLVMEKTNSHKLPCDIHTSDTQVSENDLESLLFLSPPTECWGYRSVLPTPPGLWVYSVLGNTCKGFL